MSDKGTIAILTGGGDVPGLNPAIRAITIRALREGYRVRRHPARLGRARGLRARERRRQHRQRAGAVGGDREPRRSHRRHVPPHVAHAAEPSAARARAAALTGYDRHGQRHHEGRSQEPRAHRRRHADPDRWRRHAELRQATARRGRERRGDPEDDGQRRLRHRLLHRLQHVRHAHDRAHAQPAHVGRLARALSRDRSVRPVRGLHRAAPDDGRRRRPLRHPRACRRRRASGGAADVRPQSATRAATPWCWCRKGRA